MQTFEGCNTELLFQARIHLPTGGSIPKCINGDWESRNFLPRISNITDALLIHAHRFLGTWKIFVTVIGKHALGVIQHHRGGGAMTFVVMGRGFGGFTTTWFTNSRIFCTNILSFTHRSEWVCTNLGLETILTDTSKNRSVDFGG